MNTPVLEDRHHGRASVRMLNGREGGVWEVTTRSSSRYVFDLDMLTVAWHPGPGAVVRVNDTTGPIDVMEKCAVGESGAWTIKPEPELAFALRYYWQACTHITRIERLYAIPTETPFDVDNLTRHDLSR